MICSFSKCIHILRGCLSDPEVGAGILYRYGGTLQKLEMANPDPFTDSGSSESVIEEIRIIRVI